MDRITATVLSEREFEVLGRVAAGASNKRIARELGLSMHTVKRHVARTMYKLGAGSRSEAASLYRNFVPLAAREPGEGAIGQLTPREREVLEHVAVGASNHRIAAELRVRVSTVKRHTANIREKLGVHSSVHAGALLHGFAGAAA
jgi:DNA-binding NarL/FixJ family response regulator